MIKNTDIKLKGHGSFYVREGWLRKGLVAIENEIFAKEKDTVIENLGVGSNMVQAIKYWVKALGIAEDKKGAGNKTYLRLTDPIGKFINEYDCYLEETGSLALMHYKLINNFKMATSFSIIFNLDAKEFTKQDAEESILKELTRRGYSNLPLASIDSDVQCLIKTYVKEDKDNLTPEVNNISPFSILDIIGKSRNAKGQFVYTKKKISKNKLDKLIFLYVILDKTTNSNKKVNTTINTLLEEDGNVGKVFNLDRNDINTYLDELSEAGYIRVVRTAGLNQIYFDVKDLTLDEILKEYYTKSI